MLEILKGKLLNPVVKTQTKMKEEIIINTLIHI
jgi:hypothetical protein